jgi:glycosyltransferase involved in cell wall biosynthesis
VRILFVNQRLLFTGGVRVVCEHARRLRARGHEVALLAPQLRPPPLRELSVAALKAHLFERWSGTVEDGLRLYGLTDAVVRFDPARPETVPDADVIVATAWETAEWVAAMPARAGRKYYFIQGHEVWSEEIRERVERTWTLPLRKLVVARWLERLASERFGERVWARIPNGVDCERFTPAARPVSQPVSVGMLYDIAPWKGAADGLAALWSVHRARPDLPMTLFGRHRLRHRLPPGSRYLRNPLQRDLPSIYRSADVFLSSSLSEGFSLVTLEAMACGCALVATAVGEVPEMGKPGVEYLMVPPRDPDALAQAALELIGDEARRRGIASAGVTLARRYAWDHSTDLLEEALVRVAPESETREGERRDERR